MYALFSVANRAVSGFSVLSAEDRWAAANDVPTTHADEIILRALDSPIPIPMVFHRSHKYAASSLQPPLVHSNTAEKRLLRNLNSCARLNPNFETWYYEDADVDRTMTTRVIPALQTSHPEVAADLGLAWQRLSRDPVLSQIMVLKMDVFRLAVVWLYGGWWLDADALCVDDLASTLQAPEMVAEIQAAQSRWNKNEPAEACAANSPKSDAADASDARTLKGKGNVGCVFAWEGEVLRGTSEAETTSSPLNWAFGCAPRHPLPLLALQQSVKKVCKLLLYLELIVSTHII